MSRMKEPGRTPICRDAGEDMVWDHLRKQVLYLPVPRPRQEVLAAVFHLVPVPIARRRLQELGMHPDLVSDTIAQRLHVALAVERWIGERYLLTSPSEDEEEGEDEIRMPLWIRGPGRIRVVRPRRSEHT